MRIPCTSRYDTRDLVDMLSERRSRDEKNRILWAIHVLRRDDAEDAAEAARLQKDDGQTVATEGDA
jgi:hypothetical protein